MDYTTVESISKLSEPDPELTEWQKTIVAPPFDKAKDIAKFRAWVYDRDVESNAALGPPQAGVHEYYETITLRDGHPSQLKICTNEDKPPGPLFVLAFGGGFATGSNEQLTPFARTLVHLYGGTAVNLSYRTAPEDKWPTAHHDCWDSLKWLAANAATIGADPDKGFILGGISAGANITAVLASQALKEGLNPPLTGCWECVPSVFKKIEHVPVKYQELYLAPEQNAMAPILDKAALELYYSFSEPDFDSEWYTPYAVEPQFKGLPATYIQVDGLDPLRDDGIIHEKILREHGVKTKIDVWPGLPHAHFAFMPQTTKATKKALSDTFQGFAWLLNTEIDTKTIGQSMVGPASG